MSGDEMHVNVTWCPRGFIGSAAELKEPVIAVSLGGLRRKIESLMVPDSVELRFHLDQQGDPRARRAPVGWVGNPRPAREVSPKVEWKGGDFALRVVARKGGLTDARKSGISDLR